MLFQGKEFTEAVVREAYEEAKMYFLCSGLKAPDFEEWVEYNNNYYEKKAQKKSSRKPSKKSRG